MISAHCHDLMQSLLDLISVIFVLYILCLTVLAGDVTEDELWLLVTLATHS